jgi:RHS repeat-associated protein
VANESDLSATNLYLDDFLVVHEKTTSSLNIVSTANYYPFGMKMDAESYDHIDYAKQRYGYNGNEEIDGGDLTLMDFNARIYVPSLGRFMGADALASISAASSPFAFASNNPVNFIDPTGLTTTNWFNDTWNSIEQDLAEFDQDYYGPNPLSGSFRIGPGSGNYWSDGIQYSDWTPNGGSATYRAGLARGFTDIGGNLYRFNSDGTKDMYDYRNGQVGFWVDRGYLTFDIGYVNGESTLLQTAGVITTFVQSSGGGFGSGFADGFGAGVGSTVDFFKSLGTAEGWQALGQGVVDFANLGCTTCPQGIIMRAQMADATANYVQNIPNMSSYQIGYDLGFGSEKALEIAITRRVMPLSKSFLGVRNVGNASKFSTIQSVKTYGKWGTFSQRRFTWPTGGYTLDRATFFNRNFIIPSGRTIGVGQLQHFQD